MEELITHTATAIAGALVAILSVWFYAKKQNAVIATQQAKDAYELDKIRRSDAYQELLRALEDGRRDRDTIRKDIIAQDERIMVLQRQHDECLKRSVIQDVEIYKHKAVIDFLEARVKSLEAIISSPSAADMALKKADAVAIEPMKKADAAASNLLDKAKVEADRVVGEAAAVSEALKAGTKD